MFDCCWSAGWSGVYLVTQYQCPRLSISFAAVTPVNLSNATHHRGSFPPSFVSFLVAAFQHKDRMGWVIGRTVSKIIPRNHLVLKICLTQHCHWMFHVFTLQVIKYFNFRRRPKWCSAGCFVARLLLVYADSPRFRLLLALVTHICVVVGVVSPISASLTIFRLGTNWRWK